MPTDSPLNCCRLCGATSYRRVIERDAQGQLRATSLYQCAGCSVVFAEPSAWRESGRETLPPPPPLAEQQQSGSSVNGQSGGVPSAPSFSTYGLTPLMPAPDA